MPSLPASSCPEKSGPTLRDMGSDRNAMVPFPHGRWLSALQPGVDNWQEESFKVELSRPSSAEIIEATVPPPSLAANQ